MFIAQDRTDLQLVAGDQNADSLGSEASDQEERPVPGGVVQIGQRIVQQQHLGGKYPRPGDPDPLFFAAGQAAGIACRELAESYPFRASSDQPALGRRRYSRLRCGRTYRGADADI